MYTNDIRRGCGRTSRKIKRVNLFIIQCTDNNMAVLWIYFNLQLKWKKRERKRDFETQETNDELRRIVETTTILVKL
jgi:hypothetical protein